MFSPIRGWWPQEDGKKICCYCSFPFPLFVLLPLSLIHRHRCGKFTADLGKWKPNSLAKGREKKKKRNRREPQGTMGHHRESQTWKIKHRKLFMNSWAQPWSLQMWIWFKWRVPTLETELWHQPLPKPRLHSG